MGARWVFWLGLLAACSPAPAAHAPSMFLGDVALGESRAVALTLTTRAPQRLTFEVLEGDFTVDESSRALGADETATLPVRFTPTDLGARLGRLSINGEEVALSGRGTGPRISAPARVYPGPFALVSGQPEKTEHAVILMRNLGTAGSPLRLGPPRGDGAELCIGDFIGDTCQRWEAPAALDTETLLQVPLAFRVTTPGPRRWELVFPSNDFLHPELTVEVLVYVEALEPCVFTPLAEVVIENGPGLLQLSHMGPGTCLIRELTLSPANALEFLTPPRLPARLERGDSLSAWIAIRPPAPMDLQGSVHVVAALTAPFDVPVRRATPPVPPGSCLALVPSTVEFGTLARGCSSPARNVQVYNVCAAPLTLSDLSLFATGGEPAGTAGCPGATPCPEFFVVSSPPMGTVISPGPSPLLFSVQYRPAGSGADNGAVRVTTTEGTSSIVALQGLAAPPPYNVDTFQQDSSPRRTFYLTSTPEAALEVAIDGQIAPSANWSFDAVGNAVTFVLGREPGPGQTLTISYATTCTP